MNIGERFMYYPPWDLTAWGLRRDALWPHRGGDEWHNGSWFVILPLLGEVVWFPKGGFDRSGEEHLYAWGPRGPAGGRVVADCATCCEFVAEMAAWAEEKENP